MRRGRQRETRELLEKHWQIAIKDGLTKRELVRGKSNEKAAQC